MNDVDDYLNKISQNPYQFAIQFSGIYRFALLKHFPFRIVYNMTEDQNYVYVIAVFHTSRDPKPF
ncbi:MAG: type II toxin-antitoxin system RelE/ParE family toxin [Mucilaginibacter sp.]